MFLFFSGNRCLTWKSLTAWANCVIIPRTCSSTKYPNKFAFFDILPWADFRGTRAARRLSARWNLLVYQCGLDMQRLEHLPSTSTRFLYHHPLNLQGFSTNRRQWESAQFWPAPLAYGLWRQSPLLLILTLSFLLGLATVDLVKMQEWLQGYLSQSICQRATWYPCMSLQLWRSYLVCVRAPNTARYRARSIEENRLLSFRANHRAARPYTGDIGSFSRLSQKSSSNTVEISQQGSVRSVAQVWKAYVY